MSSNVLGQQGIRRRLHGHRKRRECETAATPEQNQQVDGGRLFQKTVEVFLGLIIFISCIVIGHEVV